MTVIAIFFGLVGLVQLGGFITGLTSGDTSIQLFVMGVAGIVSVLAVISVWRVKRSSLLWFGIMFLIGLSNYTGLFTEQRPPMGAMDISNWVILISVLIYLSVLSNKGLLKK